MKSPNEVWKIYQKFDYLGSGNCREYKGFIFKDNTSPYPTSREMAIDNKKSGKNVESVSMGHISKEKFNKLVKDIVKKNPKSTKEWLSD